MKKFAAHLSEPITLSALRCHFLIPSLLIICGLILPAAKASLSHLTMSFACLLAAVVVATARHSSAFASSCPSSVARATLIKIEFALRSSRQADFAAKPCDLILLSAERFRRRVLTSRTLCNALKHGVRRQSSFLLHLLLLLLHLALFLFFLFTSSCLLKCRILYFLLFFFRTFAILLCLSFRAAGLRLGVRPDLLPLGDRRAITLRDLPSGGLCAMLQLHAVVGLSGAIQVRSTSLSFVPILSSFVCGMPSPGPPRLSNAFRRQSDLSRGITYLTTISLTLLVARPPSYSIRICFSQNASVT